MNSKYFFHFRNSNLLAAFLFNLNTCLILLFFVLSSCAAQSSNVFHESRSVGVIQRMKKPFRDYDTCAIVLDNYPSINNFFYNLLWNSAWNSSIFPSSTSERSLSFGEILFFSFMIDYLLASFHHNLNYNRKKWIQN